MHTNQELTSNTGIRIEIEKSPVEVSRVYRGKYDMERGVLTAELKQRITTKRIYPNKQISSNMQDNLFSIEEFGFTSDNHVEENVETRVAWLSIPESMSLDEVRKRLASYPGACIYKVLDNHVPLPSNVESGIESGFTTLEVQALKRVVRAGRGAVDEGKIILDRNGKVQYRSVFFSTEPKEDIDLRTEDPNDMYICNEILDLLQQDGLSLPVGYTM